MEYFLERIARILTDGFVDRLDTQCIVFPSRRAGLFFMKYLADRVDKPVWAPSVMTINDLFRLFSPLRLADNEVLLFELYKAFRSVRKTTETFDDFYYWGGMLLNDFDDIDKYLADPASIFRNVRDLKMIDRQFGGLSQHQAEVVQKFWVNFEPGKPTPEKKQFEETWYILNDLYNAFREALRQKRLAYEGMIFRDAVERKGWQNPKALRWDKIHFAGFNALNECEKTLMSSLKNNGKARFYWDYDNSYLGSKDVNSAGYFLRENILSFGNDMPADWSYDTLLTDKSGTVRRTVIETSSDVAQVKLVSRLTAETDDPEQGSDHQTAIVLADENLLIPLLSSLPEKRDHVNVTMGYPMRETPVYQLAKSLLDLQSNAREKDGRVSFHHSDVMKVLENSLVSPLIGKEGKLLAREVANGNSEYIPSDYFGSSGFTRIIFEKQDDPPMLAEYLRKIFFFIAREDTEEMSDQPGTFMTKKIRNEFIYRAVLSINRMKTLTGDPEVNFTVRTFAAMLERILRAQSVPFIGEPLKGIQIMGLLETRTLDFRNIIILSVNEGVLPSLTTASSFIPFSLREAFGLPSINHQESVYAYHFYRLLHRARNVTFIYNSGSEGLRSGEISRFILQMKYGSVVAQPDHLSLNLEIKNPASPGEFLERTETMNLKLMSRFSGNAGAKIISPSAINVWLGCRMKFWYRYVNDIREPVKQKGEIDPATLGSIFHDVAKRLYMPYLGQTIEASGFEALGKNREYLGILIDTAVREHFPDNSDSYSALNELISENVLMTYISRILETDRKYAPVRIIALEKPVQFRIGSPAEKREAGFLVGGIIDRIDSTGGTTRIVDYKTGSVADHIKAIGELFEDDRKRDIDCWLQALLYCEGYISGSSDPVVAPAIYKIRRIPGDRPAEMLSIKVPGTDEVVVGDYNMIRDEYLDGLQKTIKAMFGIDEPFYMTRDWVGKCSYCEYRRLCKR